MNLRGTYDLCLFQKFNKYEHGFAVNYAQYLNSENLNSDKVVKFFNKNKNIVFASYLENLKMVNRNDSSYEAYKKIISSVLKDYTIENLDRYNKLRQESWLENKSEEVKIGIVFRYEFNNYILCKDKTFLIVNLQRRFREKQILKKIKANIIHRYWRKCSWDPSFKLGKKLVLERALKDN
tara:strand:- start:1850 stop:2389 length:540 start_codon:yes stop_codon:yes gene_type:complete